MVSHGKSEQASSFEGPSPDCFRSKLFELERRVEFIIYCSSVQHLTTRLRQHALRGMLMSLQVCLPLYASRGRQRGPPRSWTWICTEAQPH